MEVLIFIALIVLFILLSNLKSIYRNSLKELSQTVDQLTREIRGLRSEINSMKQSTSVLPQIKSAAPKEEIQPKPVQQTAIEKPVYIRQKEELIQEPKVSATAVRQYYPRPQEVKNTTGTSVETKENWLDKWKRNNPDWEKFIGENLVNKIGIAVLVLGIAFFVKYAIDKDWINEIGRVSIGLLCGAVLVGIAHFLRNSYRSFSSVLAGGGIAVFYFTIAFAFHQYHILDQTTAFIIMVVITAFAVVLSILYDKIELAIIGAIGGFITPFLLATGEGNFKVLFTYVAILNIGLLSLSFFKRWPLVNIVALFFTELIYGGWLIITLNNPAKQVSYPVALLFASLFYIIFLGMNMLYQVKNRLQFKPFDFSILLFLTATYYSAGMVLLSYVNNGAYQGIFTLALGLINLCLAWYFFRNKVADRNLLFLLIGLTLTFITLTIPVQLHGHTITIFWAAETVLLLWLFQRSGIRLFKLSSVLIGLLTFISLMMDWNKAAMNPNYQLTVMFTDLKGIITNLVVIASFAAYGWLLGRQEPNEEHILTLKNGKFKVFAYSLSGILLYLTCIFGVNLYFGDLNFYSVPNTYHRLITYILSVAFILWFNKIPGLNKWMPLVIASLCLIMHIFSYSLISSLRNGVLEGRYAWQHLLMHWISVIILLYISLLTILYIRNNQQRFERSYKALSWTIPLLLTVIISIEGLHIYTVGGHNAYPIATLQYQYSKVVLTIIWAVCSFVLMWFGMKYKNKTLRIASLSLFSLALLKLFLSDLRGISEGGKITAFILLGVLLLTISFMYQKLKKMLFDDVPS